MALKRSPEFCLKLIYRYLLKDGHFPSDTYVVIFGPRAIILTNLVEVQYMMLHTKYQCSGSCGRQEDF